MKFIFSLLFLATSAWAQTVTPIPTTSLLLGKSVSTNKIMEFNKGSGATNPKLRYNVSGSQFEIANDGTTYSAIATVSGLAGTFVFALDGDYWTANGGSFPANDQGARFIAPFNLTITDVCLMNKVVGSSGTSEFQLKKSTSGTGTWTSIFSTTPKVTTTASGDAWICVGDTATGYTAPVLTGATMLSKQALRLDIVTAMAGQPQDAYIIIKYTPQ